MRAVPGLLVAVGVSGASAAWAGSLPTKVVYVDCGAAPGGTGSSEAPYDTIGGGLAAGRAFAATNQVVVSVAEGVCDDEVLPIVLDYAVHLRGARVPKFDASFFPIDDQTRDTVVTWPAPVTVPSGFSFLRIQAGGVRVSRLTVDGKLPVLPDGWLLGPGAWGIVARSSDDYAIDQVRIVNTSTGFRAEGGSGRLTNSYLGRCGSCAVFSGGVPGVPGQAFVFNNRMDYRADGLVVFGGAPASGGGAAGEAVEILTLRNDLITSYTDSGPSNPGALRVSPVNAGARAGSVKGTFLLTRIGGTPKYPIEIHGGSTQRRADGLHYSGDLDLTFLGTTISPSAQAAPNLIMFTAVRAVGLPCELDPTNGRDVCPSLPGPPNAPIHLEYLQDSVFDIRHGGELGGAQIEHPEFDRGDGRELGNALFLNDAYVDYQTFLVIP